MLVSGSEAISVEDFSEGGEMGRWLSHFWFPVWLCMREGWRGPEGKCEFHRHRFSLNFQEPANFHVNQLQCLVSNLKAF
jgi:hypothetical protein